MKLLLISNSTNAGEGYLEYPIEHIKKFLAGVTSVVFVPYAGVTFSFDAYREKVAARFAQIGIQVESVHNFDNPEEAIRGAQAIVVGGGNTFQLTKIMQETGLIDAIREKVIGGTPYVGWSAGSNVACPTICTTNDMPIVEPRSFVVTGLVLFQINPHYLDAHPDGHAGETREQRIEEYITANPKMYVAGLREGCMLWIEDGRMKLIGNRSMRVFKHGKDPMEYEPGTDLSFLLSV